MTGGIALHKENQQFIEAAFSNLLRPFWYRHGLDTEWWGDFVHADRMGWRFKVADMCGARMYLASRDTATGWVPKFFDLMAEVMLKTSAECHDNPKVAALRQQGWRCVSTQWSHLTQAYCFNEDGRFMPLYVNADAAWAELVRSQA